MVSLGYTDMVKTFKKTECRSMQNVRKVRTEIWKTLF